MFEMSIKCFLAQALENVSSVMTNLLRVQSKMEATRDKLSAIDSADAKQSLESIPIQLAASHQY
jgi:hypothetical protein